MNITISFFRTAILLGVLLLGGCATLVPDTALYLGEVAHLAAGDDILKGVQLGPDKVPPPIAYQEKCISDSNVRHNFALIRFSYFWTRAGGAIHNYVDWAIVPNGLALKQGNIVELNIARSKLVPSFQCPIVTSVYFRTFDEGACEYRVNERGVAGFVVDLSQVLIGGRGSKSIYCPGLDKAGWDYLLAGPEKSRAWKKNYQ